MNVTKLKPHIPVRGLIYLASPYTGTEAEWHEYAKLVDRDFSDPDEASWCAKQVAAGKYLETQLVTACLLRENIPVLSPICHSHHLAETTHMPVSADFWLPWNRAVLGRCSGLWVACMTNWRNSTGVRGEIEYALQNRIPVSFLCAADNEFYLNTYLDFHGDHPWNVVPLYESFNAQV